MSPQLQVMELRREIMGTYLNQVIADRNLGALVLPWLFPGNTLDIHEEAEVETTAAPAVAASATTATPAVPAPIPTATPPAVGPGTMFAHTCEYAASLGTTVR